MSEVCAVLRSSATRASSAPRAHAKGRPEDFPTKSSTTGGIAVRVPAMPKLKTDIVTDAALEKYLLASDDFAFEIACLRELQKRPALKVSHAGTYSDPVTRKSRQFDIRIEFSPLRYLRIAVALECKNLRPFFPLTISRLPRRPEEAFHELLLPEPEVEPADGLLAMASSRALKATRSQRLEAPQSPYAVSEMVGKATVQVGVTPQGEFHSDDSEVYEKWAQAVNSAYDLIANTNRAFTEDAALKVAYVIIPAVVVPEGTLWVKDYRNDGTPASPPTQVDEATLYLDHGAWTVGQMFSFTISHLHFVTLKGLGSFIDRHLVNSNFHRLLVPVG